MNLASDYSAALRHMPDLYWAIQLTRHKSNSVILSEYYVKLASDKTCSFIAIKAAYLSLLKVMPGLKKIREGPDAVRSQEMTRVSALLSEKRDPNCTYTHSSVWERGG